MAPRRYAAGLLVLCAVLWSTGGLLIKWIAWPALAVAGLRSALAAVVLLLFLREWRGGWSWWLGSGALAGAASMLGFVIATKLTAAANAIFLVYTAPLYVALLSPWVLREPVRRGEWLTILLALLGMGCFCMEQLTWEGWVGHLCALGSGLATAWLVVCLRKHAATSPLPILVLANVLVAIVGVPFLGAARLDPVSWGLVVLAGVGQLGVPLVLYSKAIPHVRAIEAVLIPVLEPVLNPVWVWLLVGEVPSGWALLGGAIVLGAVTVRGLAMVWPAPRGYARIPCGVRGRKP
ncbi:MAG TPA: DMT family transporter [Candidatus Tectomicrobia bacterium]